MNFDKNPLLKLNGDWEFYWSQFIEPNELKAVSPEKREFIKVPGSWNRVKNYPQKGFATYRLHVELAEVRELALEIPAVWSASRIFLDDQL